MQNYDQIHFLLQSWIVKSPTITSYMRKKFQIIFETKNFPRPRRIGKLGSFINDQFSGRMRRGRDQDGVRSAGTWTRLLDNFTFKWDTFCQLNCLVSKLLRHFTVNSSPCTRARDEKAAISNSNAAFCLYKDIFVCGRKKTFRLTPRECVCVWVVCLCIWNRCSVNVLLSALSWKEKFGT